MNTNVLEVSELSVSFLVDEEYIKCVRNVSYCQSWRVSGNSR